MSDATAATSDGTSHGTVRKPEAARELAKQRSVCRRMLCRMVR